MPTLSATSVQKQLRTTLEQYQRQSPATTPAQKKKVEALAKEIDGYTRLSPQKQQAFLAKFIDAVGSADDAAWLEQMKRTSNVSLGFETVEKKPPLLAGLTGKLVEATLKDGGPANGVPAQIAGVPVKAARVVTFDGLTGNRALMQQGTQVSFGKLTKPQFDALHAELGGRSTVPYDAAREYGAVDFLPPALQKLAFKDYDAPAPVKLAGTANLREMDEGDYNIAVTPNCHGTAWEAMRAYQGPAGKDVSIFYGDAIHADASYAQAGKFENLGDGFQSKLKPGDVVVFHEDMSGNDGALLHSAVYAGGGLYFEKPDTEMDDYAETPYRLVTYEQLTAPIKDFLGGSEPRAAALRPAGPLEPGEKAFAFEDEKLEKWVKKKGTTLGRPLVVELEVGMGGATRGIHATAVDALPL